MFEKRKFHLHPAAIYQVIYGQAGSLGKAILECLMNSVDAGATKVDITANTSGMKIVDDGKGFRSKKEILDWFETLGFPHDDEENSRTYGQFGIGRAQLWAFAKTVWSTNEFQMDVDIKHKGLDYDLREGVSNTSGLTIDAVYYDKLKLADIQVLRRELGELARYLQIPVSFNGEVITKSPTGEKWTHETEDAYILLKPTASELSVYNLGVLVSKYPAYSFGGVGGLVITKPGVRLTLNTARNDILQSKCEVWKRIRPFIRSEGEKTQTKNTRLTEEQLKALALDFTAGELSNFHFKETKLITYVNGKGIDLKTFFSSIWDFRRRGSIVTAGKKGDRLAVKIHESNLGMVLSEQTLQRFDVSSATELIQVLNEAFEQAGAETLGNWLYTSTVLEEAKLFPEDTPDAVLDNVYKESKKKVSNLDNPILVVDNLNWVGRFIRDSHEEVKAITDKEKIAMSLMSYFAEASRRIVSEVLGEKLKIRRIRLGESATAEAWTDGLSIIWINRERVLKLFGHFGNWTSMLSLCVHEMLHNEADLDSHIHDEVFMERFHEAILSEAYVKSTENLMSAYRRFLSLCEAKNIKLTLKTLRSADMIKVEEFDSQSEPLDDLMAFDELDADEAVAKTSA